MTRTLVWTFWVTTVLLGFSGYAYFYMTRFMSPTDPFSVLNHPLQPWMLKAHILAAPFFVLVFGAMIQSHVLPKNASKSRVGRRSGLFNITLISVAILSGYLFQISSHETLRSVWSWTHIVSSTLFILMILGHLLATFRVRKKKPSPF